MILLNTLDNMGWGTFLMANIYFHKETYKSKYQVEEAIEESKVIIKRCEQDLKNLALITEPKKYCDEEEDPLMWINNNVDESINLLQEEYYKLFKLELLLDNWDKCHTKDDEAIVSFDKDWWTKAYCGGDFIKEVYPDGSEVKN